MKYCVCAMLFATVLACCPNSNLAQNTNSPATSIPQGQPTKTDGDKIYKPSEVDTKAVLKKKPEPSMTSSDCPDSGTVRLGVILDKSGKVTNIKLIKGTSCGFDDSAIKAARKIKFTPALKNGVSVSMYVILEYYYSRY